MYQQLSEWKEKKKLDLLLRRKATMPIATMVLPAAEVEEEDADVVVALEELLMKRMTTLVNYTKSPSLPTQHLNPNSKRKTLKI